MRLLASELEERSFATTTWEGLARGGQIFTKVVKAILEHDVLVAEVSDLNLNVLVEAGTAMALGRDPVLLVNQLRDNPQLRILGTFEQCHYRTREEIGDWLEDFYRGRKIGRRYRKRTVPVLEGVQPLIANHGFIHFLPSAHDDHSMAIRRTVSAVVSESESLLASTTTDPDDSLFDSFTEQAAQIAPASAVVGYFVPSDYKDSVERNATVALMLGLAIGWGKRAVALVAEPSARLLDPGTVSRHFRTESDAQKAVWEWWSKQDLEGGFGRPRDGRSDGWKPSELAEVPKHTKTSGDMGPPVYYLGSPDAAFDPALASYFVRTPDFEEALAGTREIFVGRKGVGKTANFRLLEATLESRQGSIPVAVAPIDVPVNHLASLLAELELSIHPEFLYPSFWRFIIFTEIVKSIVNDRPQILNDNGIRQESRSRIEGIARELEDPIRMEFHARIVDTLRSLREHTDELPPEAIVSKVESLVGESRLYGLESSLRDVADRYQIHIAVDDLDKRWDPSSPVSVQWIKSLIDELRLIRRRFDNKLITTVFLREDILDYVRESDVEYTNRSIRRMQWSRNDLVELLAQRIESEVDTKFQRDERAWGAVFPRMGTIEETIDYVLDRTLMRPRDMISFGQAIIDQARRNRHSAVEIEDILEAERVHSEWMVDSVRTEYLYTYPGIERAIFTFQGCLSPVQEFDQLVEDATANLQAAGHDWCNSPEETRRALYEIGFIGVQSKDGSQVWYSISRRYQDALLGATSPPVMEIHPAFRRHLAVQVES